MCFIKRWKLYAVVFAVAVFSTDMSAADAAAVGMYKINRLKLIGGTSDAGDCILPYSGVKEGVMQYREAIENAIARANIKLIDLNVFDSVRVFPVYNDEKGTANIITEASDGWPLDIDGADSFSMVKYRNSFGRIGLLYGAVLYDEISGIKAGYVDPLFSVRAQMLWKKYKYADVDMSCREFEFKAGTGTQFFPELRLSAFAGFENIRDCISSRDYLYAAPQAAVELDKRDKGRNSTSGFYAEFSATDYMPLNGGDGAFDLRLSARFYQKIFAGVLATNMKGAVLTHALPGRYYFMSDSFFDAFSLMETEGFRQYVKYKGSQLAMVSAEYRCPVTDFLDIVPLADIGNASENLMKDRIRILYGGGLRYHFPSDINACMRLEAVMDDNRAVFFWGSEIIY